MQQRIFKLDTLDESDSMETRIFHLIILYVSGSMERIKKAAVSSVNETVQTIRAAQCKHNDQKHFVSLVSVNDEAIKTIFDCVPAMEVKELTDEQYVLASCTPLYDAMGHSLNTLRRNVTMDDMVLVTVVTDGMENSSKEYTGKDVKERVNELKAWGRMFAYTGAYLDVEQADATISIQEWIL